MNLRDYQLDGLDKIRNACPNTFKTLLEACGHTGGRIKKISVAESVTNDPVRVIRMRRGKWR